jgi:hypothetical protein
VVDLDELKRKRRYEEAREYGETKDIITGEYNPPDWVRDIITGEYHGNMKRDIISGEYHY